MLNQIDAPDSEKIKVSNKGRVLTRSGVKTAGSAKREEKHRSVRIGGKFYCVHQLIYAGFYNKPCPKAVKVDGQYWHICHNDDVELVDGYHRNWPEDLRLDTANENVKEAWSKRKRLEAKLKQIEV
jgi:hypothetical protein